MSKGNAAGMLGVGGTRSKLSRGALRGATGSGRSGRGGREDPNRRELLRKMQERTQKG
ncbi:DUF6243 family protein [Streptomyces sp. YGL11-2]|uniref:DUF6243 family protein n=1 Tax=Streptomyces sp. YGL11-2 TaxID=3414028 RepID=UPI003CEC2DB9